MFAESLALQRCQRWSLLLALWTLVAGNFTSWPATAMRYPQTWPQLTSSRGLGFDESHHTLGACQVLREPRMPLLWAGNLGFTMFQDGRRKKHWGILRPSIYKECNVAWNAWCSHATLRGELFLMLSHLLANALTYNILYGHTALQEDSSFASLHMLHVWMDKGQEKKTAKTDVSGVQR